MPIINRDDAKELDLALTAFFNAPPTQRAQRLRQVFTGILDFNPASGRVSLANAPKGVELPADAERIATLQGVHVVYVPVNPNDSDRVRKTEAAAAAKVINDQLGDLLLLMTNKSGSQLHFILPSFVAGRPSLRRIVIERDLRRYTAVQQVSNVYWRHKDGLDIHSALEDAFDVEKVTKEFFSRYKEVHEEVYKSHVSGFGSADADKEEKKYFVQALFNRLMFVYFLSRKRREGWLTFDGKLDYLNALWDDYEEKAPKVSFYRDRLRPLFSNALNNPQSRDTTDHPGPQGRLGKVPFLNGGLFQENPRHTRPGVDVANAGIDLILHGLFDKFNFTVMESTPLDVEVAVDPEMLGKIFEELVTGRHESGSYYTPRPVVAFMCREALKGYLETQNTGAFPEAISAFVDHRDTSQITISTAPKIGEALARVTVVDPACGFGAYLLGMMQELVELMTVLYSARLSHEAQDLYNLKLRIIEQNLYGADIDQFAVNIAMLRLWLSLAIDYDGPVPPPLPNLDFKIACGDSLLGPNPNPENYGTLFRHRIHRLAGRLAALKASHMRATGQEKTNLTTDIEGLKAQLREALAESAAPEGAVDWRVEFAEVFDQNGGFDVAIANPPYVVIKSDLLRSIYHEGIFGRMNTYGLFIQRALQLTHNGSQLVYINPRTLLTDKYFTNLRRLLIAQTNPRAIVLIEDRHHTFARVLQACIILFLSRFANPPREFNVQTRSVSVPTELNEMRPPTIVASTRVCLGSEYDNAFLISDKRALYSVFERMVAQNFTLRRIKLRAETGAIQFDKFARYVTDGMSHGSCRLIWAENVQFFAWRDSKKRVGKEWLSSEILEVVPPNISQSGILIQRVTANEQPRRIIATYIKGSSIRASGLYSENHTNFLDCSSVSAEVAAYVLAVLNSTAMDAIFRSLNSNTQVSAGELNYLPFPKIPERTRLDYLSKLVYELIRLGGIDVTQTNRERALALENEIDGVINGLYGFSADELQVIREVTTPPGALYGMSMVDS